MTNEITTATFLSTEDIKLIEGGYRHMVDNGYSELGGTWDILRSLACDIEYARREMNYVTRHQFPSMMEDAAFRIQCSEARLRNLAARSGFREPRG